MKWLNERSIKTLIQIMFWGSFPSEQFLYDCGGKKPGSRVSGTLQWADGRESHLRVSTPLRSLTCCCRSVLKHATNTSSYCSTLMHTEELEMLQPSRSQTQRGRVAGILGSITVWNRLNGRSGPAAIHHPFWTSRCCRSKIWSLFLACD